MRPPSGFELILVVAVIVLLFGAAKLPQLGSSIGSFVKNLKKGLSNEAEPEEKKLADSTGQQVQSTDKAASKQG